MARSRGRREITKISLVSILLAATLAIAWSPAQRDLRRDPQQPRIHPRLCELLETIEPHQHLKVWVFFTDKGIFDQETLRSALQRRSHTLPSRTRARRLKVKENNMLVDFADLPLNDLSIQQVVDLGVEIRTRSAWLNAVSVLATGEQLHRLAELPFVASLRQVACYQRRGFEFREAPVVERGQQRTIPHDYGPSFTHLNQITVPQLHRRLEQSGFGPPGEGVRICLLDTGFQLYHEALRHLDVLAQWDFINDDGNVDDEPGDPVSQVSHGTAVLSIVGGYAPGKLIGVAYGATFLLAKTEVCDSETPIEEDYWVAGLEWAEGLGADVVSSSLGYLDWYDYSDMDGNTAVTTVAADLAASRGVVVVNAAGNEGADDWQHIIAPADGHRVIAVGAVDTSGLRTSWSSLGPTFDGRIKPDIMACGSGTYAVFPYTSDRYSRTTGTSVATPLVSGVVALLLQADSTLIPHQVGDLLRRTASRARRPDNYYGWGVVDAYAAYLGVLPPPLPMATLRNYPNPFSESTAIFFRISGPTQARVAIFTVSGELVREWNTFCEIEEACELIWDGRNQSGQEVADGIYLCQVVTDDDIIRGKLVRLRE